MSLEGVKCQPGWVRSLPPSVTHPPTHPYAEVPRRSAELELRKVKESTLFSYTYTPLHSPPLFVYTQPSPGSKEHLQSSKPKTFAGFNSTVNRKSQQTQSKAVYLSPLWKHDWSVDLIVHSGRSSFSSQRNATPPISYGEDASWLPLPFRLSHTPSSSQKCSQPPLPKITAKRFVCFGKKDSRFLLQWHSRRKKHLGVKWPAGSFGNHVLFFCQQENYWN